jgi:hypothetical protein
MAKNTTNYKLISMEAGDVWYPDIDKANMEIIENTLSSAEFFVGSGVVALSALTTLSNAAENLRKNYYDAAFDYNNDLFFTVANNECQFISNEDVVVDLVAVTNVDASDILSATIDGSATQPGYKVFLTNQDTDSENGVYELDLSGQTKLASQPKKVFVNGNSTSYSYHIWKFNDDASDKPSQDLCDCILAIDGLKAIESQKVLYPKTTCYLRPQSAGSKSLVVYAPKNFIGTGVPLLFMSDYAWVDDVVVSTMTTTATKFDRFFSISSVSNTSSNSFLVDFGSETFEARESLKELHSHSSRDTKLSLSNIVKLSLQTDKIESALKAYDENGDEYTYDPNNQSIYGIYVNGNEFDKTLVKFNLSTNTFDLITPANSSDDIILLVSAADQKTLVPLETDSDTQAEFVVEYSDASSGFEWKTSDYDNYQLSLSGSTVSQSSYTVNNNTGVVALTSSGPDNIPLSNSVLKTGRLTMSSTKSDKSSFYNKTNKIKSIDPKDVHRYIENFRARHNKFKINQPFKGIRNLPLYNITGEEYRVPFYQSGTFDSFQPLDDFDDAVVSDSNIIFTVNSALFTLVNHKITQIYESLSDVYTSIIKIKRIRNTTNKFIVLLSDGSTNYAMCQADLDNSLFEYNEFSYSSTINDIAAVELTAGTKIFVGASDDIFEIDFSSVRPKFTSLYYNLDDGTNQIFSYIKSNADMLDISVYKDSDEEDYEIYAVIDDFPTGQKTCAALISQQIITQDTTVKMFVIGDNGGLSDNGIVVIDTSQTLITSSPFASNNFPLTYGTSLQSGSTDVVCKTSTIGNINSFTSGPLSALNYSAITIGDRILARNQITSSENGVYNVTHVGSDFFDGTYQELDNLAAGNYTFVQSGSRYYNSYWEVESTSPITGSAQTYYRLRSSNLDSGYTAVDRVFSPQSNMVVMSSPTFSEVIFDSTSVSTDVFKHQNYQVSTSNQILTAIEEMNLILNTKSILSDNKESGQVSADLFLNYEFPIGQGSTINVYNQSNLNWVLGQRIRFTDGAKYIIATVTDSTSGNFDLEVDFTNTNTIGKVKATSENFTFRELKNNNVFDTLWWDNILRNNTGNYMSELISGPEYTFDIESRQITLATGSAWANNILYGSFNTKNNLNDKAVQTFNPETHQKIDSNQEISVGNYTKTTNVPYILEHSVESEVEAIDDIVMVDKNDQTISLNQDQYLGVASTAYGDEFIDIKGSSISGSVDLGESIYNKKTKKSESIEDRLFVSNQLSSQTTTNAMLFDDNLAAALNGYDRFSSGSNIINYVIDPSSGASYEEPSSDYEPGLSNYTLRTKLSNESDRPVDYIFDVDENLFGISGGIVFSIDSDDLADNIPLIRLQFSHCYDVLVENDLIYLATNNGIFILNLEFDIILHSSAGSKVTRIYSTTDYIAYGIENYFVVVDKSDLLSDSIQLDCDIINDITSINISSPTITKEYFLVGTDVGLFAMTTNKASSSQTFEYEGFNFVAGNKLTISDEPIRKKSYANKNNLSFMYDNLASLMKDDEQPDGVGQPYISHITERDSRIFLFTDNGISEYNTLYNIDLESETPSTTSFEVSSKPIEGIACYRSKVLVDDNISTDIIAIMTSDGLYFTYDNYRTFIKSNVFVADTSGVLATPVLTVNIKDAKIYAGTPQGILSSTDVGLGFTSENVESAFGINNGHGNLQWILSPSVTMRVSQVNVPFNGLQQGLNNFNLSISNVQKDTAAGSGPNLALSAADESSYKDGSNIAKFTLGTPVTLLAGASYWIGFISLTDAWNFVPVSNSNNPALNINRMKHGGQEVDLPASIKICSGSNASSLVVDAPLASSDFANTSNIKKSSSSLASRYAYSDTQYVVDNSDSFVNQAGSVANINLFVNTIQSAIDARFDQSYSNTIFTDKGVTGFTGSSSTVVQVVSGSDTKTRLIDAINIASARTNANRFAPSSISGSDYATYISGLSNDERGYVFKNILDSYRNIEYATIRHKYNTPLFAGVDLDLDQSGFDLDVTINPPASPGTYQEYVFVKDQFINGSDYTITNNNINFDVVPPASGATLKDVRVYYSSSLPAVTSMVGLEASGSVFEDAWSAWISSQQSKIIVVLSDYIDNFSFTSFDDYVSLLKDKYKNHLIVICGNTAMNAPRYQELDSRIVVIAKDEDESFSDYVSRVSTTIGNITHPAFSGVIDLDIDSDTTSFTVTFSSGNVYCEIRDLETDDIVYYGAVTTNVAVNIPSTNSEVVARIFMDSSADISDIKLTKEFETEYLLTGKNTNKFTYDNGIYATRHTTLPSTARLSMGAVSTTDFILEDYSRSFSLSPNATHSWTQAGSRVYATGPNIRAKMQKVASDIDGFDRYFVTDNITKRLPIISKMTAFEGSGSTSVNSWWSWNDTITAGSHSHGFDTGLIIPDSSKIFAYVKNTYTGPALEAEFEVSDLVGFNDMNVSNYSLTQSLAQFNDVKAYTNEGFEVSINNGCIFKPISTTENQTELPLETELNLFGIGSSSKSTNKFDGKIMRIDDSTHTKVFKPSTPNGFPTKLHINKFKTNEFNVVGYRPCFSGSGRKIRYVNSTVWTLSSGSESGPSVFNSDISNISGLNVITKNTIGQSGSNDITTFTDFDDNFSPSVKSIYITKNNTTVTSAGLNDKLEAEITVDRNDGFTLSEYVYKFNTGDQIYVVLNWYGCKADGSAPVLISSSPTFEITESVFSAYEGGYIYANALAERGKTKGSIMNSDRIYIVS